MRGAQDMLQVVEYALDSIDVLDLERRGHILMTMSTTDKQIAAGKFKAECLALLDRVAETGESLVVTKRGRPVARIVPIVETPRTSMVGTMTFHGDIVEPLGVHWEADE